MQRCRVLLVGVLAAGPFLAQEQRPSFVRMHPILRALDSDADGVLSAAELDRAPDVLARLDANNDGLVKSDELPAFGPGPDGRGGAGAETASRGASDLAKMLMSFDRNHDGKLTKSEVPERMQGLFDRGDGDHDGLLTEAELSRLAETQEAQTNRPPLDGRGGPRGPGGGRPRVDLIMRALDTNQDGALDRDEIRNAAASLKALDTNGDSALTGDELRPNFRRPGAEPGRGERRQ